MKLKDRSIDPENDQLTPGPREGSLYVGSHHTEMFEAKALTPEERREIAECMIRRWREWGGLE